MREDLQHRDLLSHLKWDSETEIFDYAKSEVLAKLTSFFWQASVFHVSMICMTAISGILLSCAIPGSLEACYEKSCLALLALLSLKAKR